MSQAEIQTNAGKITIATVLSLIGAMSLAFLFDVGSGGNIQTASADDATTTVTVLNIPPVWTQDAQELYASATTTPTNVGTSTVWTAIATDANAEDYYFLLCGGTSTAPNTTVGFAPDCGTATQIGVSALTSSGVAATISRTAVDGDPETTDWVGWICDDNAGFPTCNASSTGAYNGTPTSSPFVVNHAGSATLVTDTGTTTPGNVVTWTSVASDATDSLRGTDQLQLFICQTAAFDATIPGCTGGTWASSTLANSNPTATTSITIPTQDQDYDAYAYFVDAFGLEATGIAQGSNTVLTVGNATPTVLSIDLGDASNQLILTVPEGETTGLQVSYTVEDENSCQNASASSEIVDQTVFVYRSGIGLPGCDDASEYNPNHCYPGTIASTTWAVTCTASSTTCLGSSDLDVIYDCTFPLWFVADPTDPTSASSSDTWFSAVLAIDDDNAISATSTTATTTNDAELLQFLSFSATTGPAGAIAYGSLQPGQNNPTLSATTTLFATGNTGLNQQVLGDDMCITYPTCSGNATSTIFASEQEYALSAVAYGAGTDLANATSASIDMIIPKNTATNTLTSDDLHWGIAVPASISIAGDYIGMNTLIGIVAPSGEW